MITVIEPMWSLRALIAYGKASGDTFVENLAAAAEQLDEENDQLRAGQGRWRDK